MYLHHSTFSNEVKGTHGGDRRSSTEILTFWRYYSKVYTKADQKGDEVSRRPLGTSGVDEHAESYVKYGEKNRSTPLLLNDSPTSEIQSGYAEGSVIASLGNSSIGRKRTAENDLRKRLVGSFGFAKNFIALFDSHERGRGIPSEAPRQIVN